MKTISAITPGNLAVILLIIASALYSCNNVPEADFKADNTSPKVGDQITLRDQTSNDPDSWEWNLNPSSYQFMKGTSSNSQDPVIEFSEGGPYTVSLTASNPDGSDTESKTDYIAVQHDHSPVVMVHSPGLEDNLLGDSPDREVRVYLPPDYYESTSKRYPVVYLLHGFYSDHNGWWEGVEGVLIINIEEILNGLISEGEIEPMIIVAPNSYNRYFGSKYANSSTAGLWEDFITQDVVSYIDAHYRTLAVRESRGIAGLSMGGNGAIKIAMKHPELFTALYSNSAGIVAFESVFLGFRKQDLITASQLESFTLADLFIHGVSVASCVACAPAYAPNPDAPAFYGDFPVTETGELIDDIWQKWLEHDPYTMLSTYKDNLKQVKILLDCGDTDEFNPSNNLFAQKLTELGIDHIFEVYVGDHTNKAALRFGSAGFPFLSENLDHE